MEQNFIENEEVTEILSEQVIEEGLKKGFSLVIGAGLTVLVGCAIGIVATKYVVTPLRKKIKARKQQKNELEEEKVDELINE